MAQPQVREVPFDEAPMDDLHAGLTERFRQWAGAAAEAAGHQAVALDLGCGEGRVAFFLAPKVKRVVGLDQNPKALEAAKARARAIGIANVEFHAVDVEREAVARFVPGGADLVVSNLFLSKAVVERAHDALQPGGAFVFTCFGPGQWAEAGGSPFAHGEAEVRGWLEGAHLKVEEVHAETTRVRFPSLPQVPGYIGEDAVQKWLRDGRWDKLVASFQRAKVLTESRLTVRARR